MAIVRMTAAERQRYVYWWVRHSGLTARQLRQIATGIWSDRLLDDDVALLKRPNELNQPPPWSARRNRVDNEHSDHQRRSS
jgi:hypothetical protein